MSKLSKLLQVTEEEKNAILKHYSLSEEEFEENVRMLREWIKQCEHLPHDDDDHKLKMALLNSKMSTEKAKQCLEGYYRVRNIYSNEIFDKLTPDTKEYIESKKLIQTVVMPRLTPNLCRITIFKLLDPNGEASNAFLYQIPTIMIAEIRITKELCLSNIIIVDFESHTWRNLIKYTPTVNQKLIDILNSINLRIRSIIFLNSGSIIDQIMKLVKAFVPAKIVNKIKVCKSYEALSDDIPREYLPSNYGGTEPSIENLYDEWCEQIEQSHELFQKLLNAKSTAKIELDPSTQDMFGCGAEGSFKKLALD